MRVNEFSSKPILTFYYTSIYFRKPCLYSRNRKFLPSLPATPATPTTSIPHALKEYTRCNS